MDNAQDEIILFDKNLNELDRMIFKYKHIMTNSNSIAADKGKNIYALPAYFSDNSSIDFLTFSSFFINNF